MALKLKTIQLKMMMIISGGGCGFTHSLTQAASRSDLRNYNLCKKLLTF